DADAPAGAGRDPGAQRERQRQHRRAGRAPARAGGGGGVGARRLRRQRRAVGARRGQPGRGPAGGGCPRGGALHRQPRRPSADPRADPNATRIPELAGVDDAARGRADGGSAGGTGGMASKLEAARLASAEGTTVLIAGGAETRVIERALAGEDVGTLITVAA